jgi:DNA-binding NtrC family response regulator
MEKAKVALFEDDEAIRDFLRRRLLRSGHSIEVVASNMSEARQVVASLEQGEVDVAVVDGNMGIGSGDGAEITALLHDKHIGVIVVGHSSSGEVPGADVNADKMGSTSLLDIIAELPSNT